MFLKTLKLKNFRNYKNLDFKFNCNITILIGNNAQGKSNFLESIYVLATAKSFKADEDRELIKNDSDSSNLEGSVENSEGKVNLEINMFLSENFFRKKIKVNGIPRRSGDYSLNLAAVSFSPEDINLVIGSPSSRRSHVDSVISQVNKKYKKSVSQYENIITRKNKVLKAIRDGFASLDQLIFWTDQQILLGSLIAEERRKFFEFLNSQEKNFGNYKYEYLENVISRERLEQYQEREIDSASSLVGPHRDDFLFIFVDEDGSQRDMSKFGSRGEQRTAVLDLKLTESFFIESVLGERPLLLLDDIFSELDISHQQHVLEISKLQQTIITSVELDKTLKKSLKDARIFFVENGQITLTADK